MTIKSTASSTFTKWFYLFLVLIILVGAMLTIFIWNDTQKLIIDDFRNQSEMAAAGLNPEIINKLDAAYPERDLAEYQRLQQQFNLTLQVFPSYQSISVYGGLVDGIINLLISSGENDTNDADINEPINPESAAAISKAYRTGKSVIITTPFADNNEHISVFSPIIDQETGTASAVLETVAILEPGSSIRLLSSLIPIIITVLLAGGLYAYFSLKSRFPDRTPLFNALFAGFVCIQFTAVLTSYVYYTELRTRHESFQNLVAIQKRSMILNWNSNIDTRLDYLSQFFTGSEEVTRSEFKSFTQPFNRTVIVDNWRWIPVVSDVKRSYFVQSIQMQDISDFSIWQQSADGRKIESPADQDNYYPIVFIEPQQENSSLIGFDLRSEPTQWFAIAQSIDSGLPTLTYFEKSEVSHGFNMYQPIYYPV